MAYPFICNPPCPLHNGFYGPFKKHHENCIKKTPKSTGSGILVQFMSLRVSRPQKFLVQLMPLRGSHPQKINPQGMLHFERMPPRSKM